jgi:aarF domain-containing kinase
MRGAALKLGQFMSIQGMSFGRPQHASLGGCRADDTDNNMLPPEIEKVLQQVQAHANYMPDWQMEVCLVSIAPAPT